MQNVLKMRPLVVDLDGTLIKSDLLFESFFSVVGQDPKFLLAAARSLLQGKARFKNSLATDLNFQPERMPYDPAVLAQIEEARAAGREVYLASASNERYVKAIADHLGLFSGWMASDADVNLSGTRKSEELVRRFGSGQFDYIGNSRVDLEIWKHAAVAITVRAGAHTRATLQQNHSEVEHLPTEHSGLRVWARLLRVHQYAKNGLLIVPLVTAHAFNLSALLHALLGVVSFSLSASSVYILNDLIDINADRGHPTKHLRPLASGTVPIAQAVAGIPILLALSFAIAFAVSVQFVAVLVLYQIITTAYSFTLKRKMLVDVITLAALYTIRVVAGAVAIEVVLSEWLLGFSMFIFISLALIKRYVELGVRLDRGMSDPTNRNYKLADLPIIATMSIAAGFNAVTVLALYVTSPDVNRLYRQPWLLWLLCPVITYWIGRMVLMAHRRWVPEDPIEFAIRDRVSLVTLGVCLLIMIGAWL